MPDIDPAAVMAAHEGHSVGLFGPCRLRAVDAGPHEARCEPYRLAEALWQHALANGGCVPKPAYDDLGDEHRALLTERDALLARVEAAERAGAVKALRPTLTCGGYLGIDEFCRAPQDHAGACWVRDENGTPL